MRDFSQGNFFQRWFFLKERELFSRGFFLRPVRFGIYIFKKTSVSLLQLKKCFTWTLSRKGEILDILSFFINKFDEGLQITTNESFIICFSLLT